MKIIDIIYDGFDDNGSPLEYSAICPYQETNCDLVEGIRTYFSCRDWRDVKMSDLDLSFGSDYVGVFYYLGWEALRYFTPAILSICVENREDTGEISFLPNSIYLNHEFISYPKSYCMVDLILSFKLKERMAILSTIVYLNNARREILDTAELDGVYKFISLIHEESKSL